MIYANLNSRLVTEAERGNEPVLRSTSSFIFKSERYLLRITIKRKKMLHWVRLIMVCLAQYFAP